MQGRGAESAGYGHGERVSEARRCEIGRRMGGRVRRGTWRPFWGRGKRVPGLGRRGGLLRDKGGRGGGFWGGGLVSHCAVGYLVY